ncbi:hypothetical protein BGP_1680 [Beggiatoa sp. PS]|nr:hypothetical protein BGP_1680 [Beggiatoa sp. PS]
MALKWIYRIRTINMSKISSTEEKLDHWRNICCWLDEAGYKSQQTNQSQSNQSRILDAQVHIENINVDENEKIEIGINIKLALPSPSDSSQKDSN